MPYSNSQPVIEPDARESEVKTIDFQDEGNLSSPVQSDIMMGFSNIKLSYSYSTMCMQKEFSLNSLTLLYLLPLPLISNSMVF